MSGLFFPERVEADDVHDLERRAGRVDLDRPAPVPLDLEGRGAREESERPHQGLGRPSGCGSHAEPGAERIPARVELVAHALAVEDAERSFVPAGVVVSCVPG